MTLQGPLSPLFDPSRGRWQLEQFGVILHRALWGAGIGFVVYAAAVLSTPGDLASLLSLILVGVLFALFFASGRASQRSGVERGVTLFCYSIIGFFIALFYVRRGASIGLDIVVLLIPMALATYLLDSKSARPIAIVSALGIVHDVLVSILFPIPASNFALLPELAFNAIILPLALSGLILINTRASDRAAQAIARLQQETAALEDTVRRRTAQLTTAAEIGRAATGLLDLSLLLSRTLQLIRERFGYYHASVFLLDDSGQNAVVAESTGEVGRILKERRHSLPVGSQSIIGYVTAQRKPRVALDVGQDSVHFKNPLLPDTRSELAIPLMVGDRLLGALDVQSTEPNAFTATDVSVLQTLADQLAIAVRNAELFDNQQRLIDDNERLLADSRKAIEELNALAGRLSRQGWQEFSGGDRAEISVSDESGQPIALPEPADVLGLAVQKRDLVSLSDEQRSALAAPIILRDQVIGALAIEEADPAHRWTADDLALAHEVADRLGLALDNARLLEQVNRERDRLTFLYESARALAASLRQTDILNTTLGFAPRVGAQHAFILLTDNAAPDRATFRSTLPGLDRLRGDAQRAFADSLASQGIVRWTIDQQRPAIVRDTAADPRTLPDTGQAQPRSVIIAPLHAHTGDVSGVVAYTHCEPNAFSDDQIPLIESISAQVSVALNNARLYQQLEQQRFGAAALAQATQSMSRSLSDKELFHALADQLASIFKAECVIYLWNEGEETLTPTSLAAQPDSRVARPTLNQPFPIGERPDLLNVMESRSVRIAAQSARGEPGGEPRDSMSLPFIFSDEVEGAVEVTRPHSAGGFGPDDAQLFQAVLTSAAYALQTARLYTQLLETADRLREVDRLKSQFLANMSHELRTPLNSIIGFSRVIMKGIDGAVTDLQMQDLSAIHSAGQHLLGLINDILDLSRIEAGKMELNFDRVDLPEIIKGVMSTTVGLVKDKPIRLTPDIQPNLPPVHADAMRIRQVLLNLMSNAAKFTEEGSITVRAFVVEKDGQHPMVHVSVKDTGIGIPEKDQSRLFQTFSQVDGSATRKVGGSGLGLSISKNLIELHGGTITVDSHIGVGSTFTFTLPVHLETSITPIELPLDGHQIRAVLAIDDDARLIDLYRRYLEPKGYTLHGLVNPREAVAAARALRPQTILLDVMMTPDHDGWQVLAELKDHPETRDIPVIICSILTEQEKARQLGAVDYLIKPILDVDLFDALRRLENHSAASVSAN